MLDYLCFIQMIWLCSLEIQKIISHRFSEFFYTLFFHHWSFFIRTFAILHICLISFSIKNQTDLGWQTSIQLCVCGVNWWFPYHLIKMNRKIIIFTHRTTKLRIYKIKPFNKIAWNIFSIFANWIKL